MQNERLPSGLPRMYYVLTGDYLLLIQTRDHLRLLAQLTEPQGKGGPDVVYLSAEALAHCFDNLADDLDRIALAAVPSDSHRDEAAG